MRTSCGSKLILPRQRISTDRNAPCTPSPTRRWRMFERRASSSGWELALPPQPLCATWDSTFKPNLCVCVFASWTLKDQFPKITILTPTVSKKKHLHQERKDVNLNCYRTLRIREEATSSQQFSASQDLSLIIHRYPLPIMFSRGIPFLSPFLSQFIENPYKIS